VSITQLEALATWTRRLADILSSGAGGLDQAITMSTRTCPPPIADHVGRLAVRSRVRGLEPALRAFADDLADPDADRLIASLILRARVGGPGLQTVLDGLADAMAAQAGARREIDAERAKPRTTARILTAITVVVIAGLLLIAHDFLAPFGTLLGELVLAAITGIFATAFWWMHALASPPARARLLQVPIDAGGRT
jgi:Flp pilus assembly protein TadB